MVAGFEGQAAKTTKGIATKGIDYKRYRQLKESITKGRGPLKIKNIDKFLINKVTLGWVRLG